MKYLKMLGLAAVAATALMAFASGSASATVLCKVAVTETGQCPTTNDYVSGTVFTAKAENPLLTVTGSTVGVTKLTCKESNVTLKSTSTGGETEEVKGEVTNLQFGGGCTTNNGFSCTVTETKGYTGTVKATDDKGGGSLHAVGKGIKTKVSCVGGLFVCEYEAPEAGVTLSVSPGNPATVTASEQKLVTVVGGSGCGTESKWDASYKTNGTNPALWVATKNA